MPSNVSQQKVNTSTSQTSKTCPTLLKSQLSKATAVQKPIVVTGGKTKQDVIADATSTGPLTPWEGDVDRLIEGQRYSVTNLLVRTFQGKKIIMQADTQQMTLQVFGPHLADICKVP